MILTLLLAAAAPVSAVDAERAFAADARRLGQWTAFRKWADPTAVMFDPQAVWAQQYLAGRRDPPASVRWWPDRSWTSCDGRTAVNSGPYRMAGKAGGGRFLTLWMRQPSGQWRWTIDGGSPAARPAAMTSRVTVRRASCQNPQLRRRQIAASYANPANRAAAPGDSGYSRSADGTLLFNWTVAADGIRHSRVQLWTGRRFEPVVDETVRPR
ncbi:hypothetical protein GCM10022280_03060 [Sphingomonas swuensis]|uniref:DUF4440 domain-containing protein n=1 Tax=Sphingomonas swuensis TaxID=977800 RepID=A0ABP7SC56_9SPHN